jgi:hypothetical protein
VVRGDVRHMHQTPENAGALFQVASQFNLLEMVSPTVTPEDGVTRYQHDRTPRPAPHPSRLARFAHSRLRTTARCTIAAGAATIYRNYFASVGGGSRSPDCALSRNPGGSPDFARAHPGYERMRRVGAGLLSPAA